MRIALAALLLAWPLAAGAQTRSITLPPDHAYGELRPGPGADVTARACRSCHSTDYIVMQPRGDAKQWEGVVTKMMGVYKANITPEDARAIAQYLATQYGK
jgi:sulfite dehydrogenase (cytochrome) subunit B